jgi:hypothetical protein
MIITCLQQLESKLIFKMIKMFLKFKLSSVDSDKELENIQVGHVIQVWGKDSVPP